jgi:hypothetical protein
MLTQILYFSAMILIKTLYGDKALSEFAACQAIFNVFAVGALLKSEKLLIGIKEFTSQHFTSFVLLLPVGVLLTWILIKFFLYYDLLSFDIRYLYFGLIAGTCFSVLNYFKHLSINDERYNSAYVILMYPILILLLALLVNYIFLLDITVPVIFTLSYLIVSVIYIVPIIRNLHLFKIKDGIQYIKTEKQTFAMNGVPTILESLASNGPVLLFVSILPPDEFAPFYLTYRACTGSVQIIMKLIPQIIQKRFSLEMQKQSLMIASKNILCSTLIFTIGSVALSLLTSVTFDIVGLGTDNYQLIMVVVMLLSCRFFTGSLQSILTLIRFPKYIMYYKILYFVSIATLIQFSHKINEVYFVFYMWFVIECTLSVYTYFIFTRKVN